MSLGVVYQAFGRRERWRVELLRSDCEFWQADPCIIPHGRDGFQGHVAGALVIGVPREHEAGANAADLCREHGMSWATLYNWKAK